VLKNPGLTGLVLGAEIHFIGSPTCKFQLPVYSLMLNHLLTDDNQTKSSSHHLTSNTVQGPVETAAVAKPACREGNLEEQQQHAKLSRRYMSGYDGSTFTVARNLHWIECCMLYFMYQKLSPVPIKPHNFGHVHHCKFLPHVSRTSFLGKFSCMHTTALKTGKILVLPPLTKSNLASSLR